MKQLYKRTGGVLLFILLMTAILALGCSSDSSSDDSGSGGNEENVAFNEPLTLEAIEAGSITIDHPWSTLKFTKNGGELEACAGEEHEIIVAAGDKICFYAENSESMSDDSSYMRIDSSNDSYIYGNIMSLVTLESGTTDASKWNPNETVLTTNKAFYYLFQANSHIKNHSTKKLHLPAITLTECCYKGMFISCSALTTAPVLPATTLVSDCYNNMFYNCQNLNYIKCLATNVSGTQYTDLWLGSVASSGTFVKAAGTTWSTGSDGIPSGWTVQEAN
ncbi:hypothetical protein [Treponema zioleckii]|uniref:hypothetical protein n=1 Tax=Treponema zioleckii TaxID=331680 RepID=UPI00168BC11B|nr:hypothetical protein [Treponema zioleckii]